MSHKTSAIFCLMRPTFLPFSPPALSEKEIESVLETLREGTWLSSGPKVKKLEEDFKKYVDAPAAAAMNSCTAALHVALLVHDIKPGDEVIVPAMTFCATANVVEHCGGTTVFADVDPETLLLTPQNFEKAITKKTKVVIPVHYAGHPVDMEAINAIAKKHNIKVVEDAAHCMPSKIGDKYVGSSDNFTTFSFYATKNMTTGEGGMMTGPAELMDQAKMLALHGMSRDAWERFKPGAKWEYDVPRPGFKYNMPEIMASLGLVQLERLNELYERRMHLVHVYDKFFKNFPYAKVLATRPGFQSSHHLYVMFLELEKLTIDRNQFIDELTARNIGSSVHYKPVHMMSYYANKYNLKPEHFPVSQNAFKRMLSLPLSSKLSPQDAQDAVAAIDEICQKYKR